MIDRELLGEVLSIKVHSIEPIIINEISFTTVSQHLNRDLTKPRYITVNLDTLGRLCKEWARSKGVTIFETSFDDENNYKIRLALGWHTYETSTETELEAIIKACEWAKDN